MATLDLSNIVNGNTIEANDVLQLYQAFGTGSGASITGLAMTGSLYGNASTATTASFSISASVAIKSTSAVTAQTASFVTGSEVKGVVEQAELSLTSSGWVDNGTLVSDTFYGFVAGRVGFNPPNGATSSVFPELAGKTLGTNAFITVNEIGAGNSEAFAVTRISGSGQILFDSFAGNPATLVFTGYYIA